MSAHIGTPDMNDPAAALSGNYSVIRDPVLIWRDERRPDSAPLAGPPPGPFIVTRSEIISRPSGTAVHIWCTREAAEADRSPHIARTERPFTGHDVP